MSLPALLIQARRFQLRVLAWQETKRSSLTNGSRGARRRRRRHRMAPNEAEPELLHLQKEAGLPLGIEVRSLV